MNRPGKAGQAAYQAVVDLSGELEKRTLNLQRSQEGYLMPYVAAYIGSQAQNKFNAKVITSLGILDSQVSAITINRSHSTYMICCNTVHELIVVPVVVDSWCADCKYCLSIHVFAIALQITRPGALCVHCNSVAVPQCEGHHAICLQLCDYSSAWLYQVLLKCVLCKHHASDSARTALWLLLSLHAGAASSNVRHDTRASVGVRSLQERSASSSASAHTNVAESAVQP
jgi:hypothetical protein